jgi:hypothetical protein
VIVDCDDRDLIGGWVKIALPAKKKAHLHSHHGELAHHEQLSFAEKVPFLSTIHQKT